MGGSSIWLDRLDELKAPTLEHDLKCDVAIVGGGIAGLLAAERLSGSGRRVVVVEADRCGRGVTGYSTAKISALHQNSYSKIDDPQRARLYADANSEGIDHIAALCVTESIDCDFERRDAVIFAETESQVTGLFAEFEAARAAGLPVEQGLDSGLPVEAWGAVRLRDQAQFNSAAFATGLARKLGERDEVEIFERSRVLELTERGDGAAVRTKQGSVRAGKVVIASHYPFADRGAFFTRLEPQRSYCIAAKVKCELPDGMFISAGSPARSVRTAIAPGDGTRRLIVGGGGHRTGKGDPRRSYSSLEEWARTHFDVAEVTHSWSSQDAMTRDHLPDVGRLHPGSDSVFVMTGFSKWGMAISAAAAVEVERLCAGAESPWSEIFGPWDGVSVRGFAEVVREGAKFTERMITGNVVDRGAPVCTHLGCRLTWNDAEDTWDCSCHGSRFAADGSVLEGPATRDLDLSA